MAVKTDINRKRGSGDVKSKKRKRTAHETGRLQLTGAATISSTKRAKTNQNKDTPLSETRLRAETLPLQSLPESAFIRQRWSLFVPLSPISISTPLAAACAEHLSPMILTYHPPFKSVVISYNNPRLSTSPEADAAVATSGKPPVVLAQAVDEFAVSYVWLTADFTLFRPRRGQEIAGWVNLQTETHIGLVCWNYFTASVERKRMPRGWSWVGHSLVRPTKTRGRLKVPEDMADDSIEEEATDRLEDQDEDEAPVEQDLGHYEDTEGNQVHGLLRFRILEIEQSTDIDGSKGFIGIAGTLLEAHEEAELREREDKLIKGRNYVKASRRREEAIMSGARQENTEA